MSFLQIKAFSIDSTDSFTFGNANITANLVTGNANVSGLISITGNLTSGNANLGNLAIANYFSGDGSLLTNISATTSKKLANGTSNVDITSSGGNVTIAVGGTGGVATFTATGANISGYANVTGNISAGNVNAGNLLTANYVAGTLTTSAQPNITSVGTLTSLTVNGDITSTGNLIVAGTTTYVNSTITDISDPLIELGGGANGATLTSDDGLDRGTLLHYYNTGATKAVDAFMGWKNSTGEFTFASNVSQSPTNTLTVNQLGNIKAGNANLGNLVTANYFTGNGSLLSSITGANVTGQVANALVAGTVYTASQPNITSVGTLSGLTGTGTINFTGASNVSLGSVGNVHITGGTSGQYLQTDGSGGLSWVSLSSTSLSNGTSNVQVLSSGNITLSAAGTANVLVATSTGVNVAGYFTATGNITGANASLGNLVTSNYFSGNGSLLTSITGGNVTGQVANALVSGTVYTAAQPNITSVGTLTSLAVSGVTNLGAVGNVTITGGSANYVLKTDGSGVLSWVAQKSLSSTVNEFTGDGTTTSFTLTATPVSKNFTFASVQGVMQPKSSYSVTGTTITFSTAPPNTALIEVTTIGLS
mgnify:CR=1 FL=1